MASLAFQVLFLWWSITFQLEELLRADERIGVRTRRAGKVGERAGEGERGLQIETGVGPGSTGDPPVPSGDSPDEMGATVRTCEDSPLARGSHSFQPAGRRPGRASRPRYLTSRAGRIVAGR